MLSVTERVYKIKQPRGGYLNKKEFTHIILDDGITLNEKENIHPMLIGLVVDYMSRFIMGAPKEEAFHISLAGAKIACDLFNANKLLSKIHGLDSESITNACKMVGYDVCFRAGMNRYKPVETINPDMNTIENISTMLKRVSTFWKKYGPIVKHGFTFEGAYTPIISSGDGDYLTHDTLWDFKVSKRDITPKYTLQLLVYYIMGKHSIHEEFKTIDNIGIYNPRTNTIYRIGVCNIPQETMNLVAKEIIGYGLSEEEIKKIEEDEMDKIFAKKKNTRNPIYNVSDLDQNIFGFSSKKEYISIAFPSKIEIEDYSTYNGEAVFWSGKDIPKIVFEQNLHYIIRFKSCFKIKKGQIPFVINKTSFLWPKEPLSTSDIYDSTTKKYYNSYLDFDEKVVKAKPILILTGEDFELFQKTYTVKEIEILDGCYFPNC